MKDFKISSNKGNATYYMMMVITVITIMVSGLLYVSLHSSIITTNYTHEIADYNNCESALQKIRGELSVALEGKTIAECETLIDNGSSACVLLATAEKGDGGSITTVYYYPISKPDGNVNYKLTVSDILGEENPVKAENLFGVETAPEGFLAEYVKVTNGGSLVEKSIIIRGVTALSGKGGITTDIKICIDISTNKVTDVVFDNYKTYSIESAQEGGGT